MPWAGHRQRHQDRHLDFCEYIGTVYLKKQQKTCLQKVEEGTDWSGETLKVDGPALPRKLPWTMQLPAHHLKLHGLTQPEHLD